MIQTWEVRWFLQDRAGTRALAKSLFGNRQSSDATSRRDWYSAPINPNCGIKLREGELQAKFLLEDHGLQAFHSAKGVVQQWQRWSLPISNQPVPDNALLERSGWVGVDKRRWLKFFRLEDDQVRGVQSAGEGHCQVEWTEISCLGRQTQSLGLEVQHRADGVPVLQAVASELFRDCPAAAQLQETLSMAYPAWLAERVHRSDARSSQQAPRGGC